MRRTNIAGRGREVDYAGIEKDLYLSFTNNPCKIWSTNTIRSLDWVQGDRSYPQWIDVLFYVEENLAYIIINTSYKRKSQ